MHGGHLLEFKLKLLTQWDAIMKALCCSIKGILTEVGCGNQIIVFILLNTIKLFCIHYRTAQHNSTAFEQNGVRQRENKQISMQLFN